MQSQQQSRTGPPPAATLVPQASVFTGYQGVPGRFDELLTPSGDVRSTWQKLHQLLSPLSPAEYSRRWGHSQRLIYENGIAYGAYGDPEGNARPWDMDPLPMLIDEAEWKKVSAGIAQRAVVLQLVLADLLGPQRLVKEGVLPVEVLFGHTGFRLPYHGQLPPGGNFLPFYAADLGRAPDGSWWVLADRTESPSGVGFALENRVVLSRMLPEVFRGMNIQRLAPFFINYKSLLTKLAYSAHENPRIVIYSRGPHHENYFEDAYLARYLGYNLVEGGDLTTRDDKVWLKTLDGLMQVDVLLRRPNSEACDPLEFSDDTSMGVAGLLRATRTQQVALANPLGSGLVESPVFMAFLPRLCKFLLGEDLLLPGIATWWCGESASLDRVLNAPDSLVVSSAYRQRGGGYAADKQLNALPADQLRDRIRANPQRYVGQERLALSTVPSWQAGAARPANLVLRSFAVADGEAYSVLSGGLARTSDPSQPYPLAIPASQGSKDAWVIGTKPVEHVTLLSVSDESIELSRTGSDLPSRVADNIYWLGRHIERADAMARLMRTFILRLTSETASRTEGATAVLVRALAAQGQIEPGFALDDIRQQMPVLEVELPRLVFDSAQVGSIRSTIEKTVGTASLVRDRLSTDSWRILVRIDHTFRSGGDDVDLTDVLSALNGLIVDLAAFEGMCMESMTRSHVFRFLDIGRRLERALQLAGLLQTCLIETSNTTRDVLEAVLEIADSGMTYRSRYRANLQLPAVLDLLLTDETNPRSIAYQVATLQQQIEKLPDSTQPDYLPHERLIMSIVHSVKMLNVVEASEEYSAGQPQRLSRLLESLDRELQDLSREIGNRYLVHTGPSRRMSSATVYREAGEAR